MDVVLSNTLYANLRVVVTNKVGHDRDILEGIRREVIRRLEDSFKDELIQSTEAWLNSPKYLNIQILDPDGWNRKTPKGFHESWDEKITEAEFETRLCKSTILHVQERKR